MSKGPQPAFAGVFDFELAALRDLPGNAAKVFLYFKMGGKTSRSAGCREIAAATGLSKDQAARAVRALCDAGLMKLTAEAAFDRKRTVASYAVANPFRSSQSHQRDSEASHSRTSATGGASTVAPVRQKPPLQSHQCDTLKIASSASPQKREDEEANKEREASRKALRESLVRIEKAAKAVAMTAEAFKEKAGGPSAADFLAKAWERGNLSPLQLSARLADPPNGFGKGNEPQAPSAHPQRLKSARAFGRFEFERRSWFDRCPDYLKRTGT